MTPQLETREVPAGKVIFREGQERNFAYIIQKGSVEIFKTIESRRVVLARLKEGEVFGEMAVISKDRRTASAVALEPCVLKVLDEAFLNRQLLRSTKTMVLITRQLAARLKLADANFRARETNSTFLSVCVFIDLLYQKHVLALKSMTSPDRDLKAGFIKKDLEDAAKQAIVITNPEIDAILDKLVRFNLVKMTRTGKGKGINAEPVERIGIVSPETFMDCARSTADQLKLAEMSTNLEYLDLDDFAELTGSTPELLFKKISRREIPKELFAVHRERAEQWADQKGRDFFRKPVRKKRTDQLEDVDDVVNVDNATLEEVLSRLGYYRAGLLYTLAGPEARRKLLDNMSKKAARILLEEDRSPEDVNPAEAEEVQEDLIEAIKTAKRLSSGRKKNGK